MRDLITLWAFLQDIISVTNVIIGESMTYSTVFEDNKSCVDLIKSPKLNPPTRHIAIKYHHFRDHAHQGHICIQWNDMAQQIADIFAKHLPESKFTSLHERFLGWQHLSHSQRERVLSKYAVLKEDFKIRNMDLSCYATVY